ncbi:transposase [Vibrio cholerae]|nr:transposase, mutator family [Vibrio cholerae B33]EHH80884.1 transposase, mutator family [Vibrio cholerae HC-22A1]EHI02374.1 transposase, mutator family [Vibrio cholerae HC-48B2]EJH68342.1 transposase, mutator family [Vibrio cholerae HC-56A2]EJH71299.1 transposase, mutator family [Vibrio cholerae HC-42A1]EKG67373.1 transposase, mutator family [Vibrio cholerae CP1040(13)]EKK95367.1 hypothetical protein VCHC17A1_2607 [Vibrio cholerae HC-17A1]EKL05329.1 hypothetical protein VCHC50A2_2649 [Vib
MNTWNNQHPSLSKSWRDKWARVSVSFAPPPPFFSKKIPPLFSFASQISLANQ